MGTDKDKIDIDDIEFLPLEGAELEEARALLEEVKKKGGTPWSQIQTGELTSLLRARYAKKGRRHQWIFLTNVRDTTGRPKGSRRRYADAVAMNLWPSKGLALHGFEIKVSRSDFLTELRELCDVVLCAGIVFLL